jgi:hypothetical protein
MPTLSSSPLPNVEERYTSAINTSNLRVDADCGGAGDVLIAVGWSDSYMGAALMRLHSEWDAAAKPLRPTKEAIAALAANADARKSGKEALLEAQSQAFTWYAREQRLLVGKLKGLPALRRELALRASRWGYQACQDKAAEVIKFWLDQTCGACHGRKWKLVPGAPALSSKMCHVCRGSGLAQTPHGKEGRRLANYLDTCVDVARRSIKNRLQSIQKRG